MTDRHRQHYPAKRSSTFNPARASLPAGIGYDPSYYADESYLIPSSSRHPITTPRGHTTTTSSSGKPTTTRTYAVSQEPRSRSAVRDSSSTRRSTLDSATRPPVIVTTKQNERGHNNHLHPSSARHGSPVRDSQRSSNSYYAVPAATHRSRSSARPYPSETHTRPHDRNDGHLAARDAEGYRSTRPSITYPNDSRHSTAAVNYGDEGYKYTNAGELVRYDLDQTRPSRSRRHDSFDKGYYRPSVSHHDDGRTDAQRYDPDRGYAVNHSRHQDGWGGPPPTTRGFDKINSNRESSRDRDLLPIAPKPPVPKPSSQIDSTGSLSESRSSRHGRPHSLGQEPAHRDEYYRVSDDPRSRKDPRDRERDLEDSRRHNSTFYDDGVNSRGFGIRPGPPELHEDRHNWQSEPRRSEIKGRREDMAPLPSSSTRPAQPLSRRDFEEGSRVANEGKRGTAGEGSDHGYTRASAAAGLGISAGVDFAHSSKDNMRIRDEERGALSLPPREEESAGRRDYPEDKYLPANRSGDGEKQQKGRSGRSIDADEAGGSVEGFDGGVRVTNDPAPSVSDSDEGRRGRAVRRQRPSGSFDPNNTSDLRQIKEQIAAMRVSSDQHEDAQPSNAIARVSRSTSPEKTDSRGDDFVDDSGSHEVGAPAAAGRQVRVVSPPSEKRDDKPLRGILKQPSARFPEEANPLREGVAPHREDKKLKDVPPGARWTKINRKIVNPEALSLGKERFEVRDDFVIVLRVLSREEIQDYAEATQVLRERRRNGNDTDRPGHLHEDKRTGRDDEDDETSSHRHRQPRHGDTGFGDKYVDRDREGGRDTDRRWRTQGDDDDLRNDRAEDVEHYRSHRDHDRVESAK